MTAEETAEAAAAQSAARQRREARKREAVERLRRLLELDDAGSTPSIRGD
jgi:hypothetical protein